MHHPKVTIAQLILVIVVVAIGLAAIRSGSPAWSGALFSITFFAMICSLLGIALGRGTRRVYWTGFALLGWSYLLLIYLPWLHENIGQYLLAPNLFEQIEVFLQARESAGGGMQSVPLGAVGSDGNGWSIWRRERAQPASPISSGSEPRWKRSSGRFWAAGRPATSRQDETETRRAFFRPPPAHTHPTPGNELRRCELIKKAQDGLQGGVSRSPINAPSNPLPRARVLWTNSKNPKYSGKVSCGIPRWGRSHDRSSDQNPSRVLT